MKYHKQIFLSGILLVLGSTLPTFAQNAEPSKDVLITLLETNDLHGTVLKPGEPKGLAKIATLVRGIRKQMPHVLLLDSGDMIQGAPDEKVFEGMPILAAMNTMGYDAAAAGNHEFDYGLDGTQKAISTANFPIISANIQDAKSGKTWAPIKPYIIKEIDGVRVAIFGLTTLETLMYEYTPPLSAVHFQEPSDAARDLVPRLRTEEHADVVIALSHLGADRDAEIAEAVPGIDIILGGHSHSTLSRQIWVGDTLICQTGSRASNLGRIDFVVHKPEAAGAAATLDVNGRAGKWWGHGATPSPGNAAFPGAPLLPLTNDIADDPEVVAAYQPYVDKMKPIMDEELTTSPKAIPAGNIEQQENAVGNLIADAVRAQSKTDIALIAGSDINKDGIPAGTIHVRDLYNLIGQYTAQAIVTVRAPGAKIAEMFGALRLHDGAPLSISGARVGKNITVNGKALDLSKTYTIAAPGSVIQAQLLGAHGVEILNDDPHGPTVRDNLIDYLRGHAPLTDAIDGRWMP